jgi:hypothetical protein
MKTEDRLRAQGYHVVLAARSPVREKRVSRTWKDLRPDQRATAKRFSERRAESRSARLDLSGERRWVGLRQPVQWAREGGQERAA